MFIQGNQPFQNNLKANTPFGGSPFTNNIIQKQPIQNKNNQPELNVPRFLNYYADYSGCGHWRMICNECR